jgi:hypothetical protein
VVTASGDVVVVCVVCIVERLVPEYLIRAFQGEHRGKTVSHAIVYIIPGVISLQYAI